MKYFLLYLFVSFSANCSEKDIAIKKSVEAIVSYQISKDIVSFQTKKITKQLNIDEKLINNFAAIIYSFQARQISTDKIKNIGIDTDFGIIRPDFNYNYITNEKSTTVKYNWSFE
jgi:hypothetical protein